MSSERDSHVKKRHHHTRKKQSRKTDRDESTEDGDEEEVIEIRPSLEAYHYYHDAKSDNGETDEMRIFVALGLLVVGVICFTLFILHADHQQHEIETLPLPRSSESIGEVAPHET